MLSPAHACECHPLTRRSTCQPFQPHARCLRPRLLSLSRRPHCHPLPPLPSCPRNGRGVRPRSPRIPFPNPNPAISGRPPLNRPQTPAPPPSTSAPPPNLAAAALRAQTEHSAAGKKLRHGILQRRRDSDLSDPVAQSQVHLEATRGTQEPGNASAPTPPRASPHLRRRSPSPSTLRRPSLQSKAR